MIDINIYESQTCKTVSFGRKGENLARRIMFDLSTLIAEFGAGSFEWVIRRPHESTVYIAVNKEQDGNTAVLNLTATETAISGYGGLELRYYVDDVIVKTIVWRTSIAASLGGGDVPDPIEDYIDQMREIAQEASESADAAGDSATQAAVSATNAAGSATEAAGYAANAAASAGAAADSVTDSAASASAAHTSETNAANSATAAAGSATNAASSAANAAASSTNAASSATQAAGSASEASTSAAQAAASATAADQAAQDIAAASAQIQTNKDDITDLKNQIDEKANIDGYYEDLTAGNAEQLLSTQYIEDSVPYLYRTSGGSADIGNREYDEIVGGTIAWNQLAQTKSANYAADVSSTITLLGTINGFNTHKYVVIWKQTETLTSNLRNTMQISVESNTIRESAAENFHLGKGTYAWFPNVSSLPNGEWRLVYWVHTPSDAYSIDDVMWFDLTQMFGSTIADYIYSLEQSTAGAGVAWFRKLFPKDYYPYNAGELLSVEGVSAHEMVGFNQWDEEWEIGGIDSYGNNVTATDRIRSKNYIHVFPSTSYFFKTLNKSLGLRFYDADKNIIGTQVVRDQTWLMPSNCHYLRFFVLNTTTYANDICINLSWSGTRNGEYEPYVKHSYPLDSSLILRGIPKLSADNKLYYDGDTYSADGTVTRRYGIVDLGTLAWTESSYSNCFVGQLHTIKPVANTAIGNAVISLGSYTLRNGNDSITTDKSYTSGYNNNYRVFVHDSSYTSASDFKTAMSGVYLVYELAEPTTESATPYQSPQIVEDWGTEEYVTESIVPVGHNTDYPANLRDKLQHLPDLADSDGYYVIQQTDSEMSLVHFRIPQAPTTDGTYVLKATVSGGTPTYTWESEA